MGSILNENDRTAICDRMRSLSASSNARWGKMNVTGMLEHLQLSAQMAVGELQVADAKKRAFQVFPLKHLILYVLPFPKGAPTATELLPGEAESLEATASFEQERAAVLALLERIGAGPREGAGPAHPLFGPLSRCEWGTVTYKHVDHHLKQFGA